MKRWRKSFSVASVLLGQLLLLLCRQSSAAVTDLVWRASVTNNDAAVALGTWSGKAMGERYVVLSSNAVALPVAASQQGLVTNLKARATNIRSAFVNQSLAVSNKLDDWFTQRPDPNPPHNPAFPRWSSTGIVSYLSLPTNIFDATPWADLVTNVLGWGGFTSSVRNLLWTTPYPQYNYLNVTGFWGFGSHTSSWAIGKSIALTNLYPSSYVEGFSKYTQGERTALNSVEALINTGVG